MHFKQQLMYGSSCDRGRFMKNFCFDTIYNIAQEPQDLQRYDYACGFIGKSGMIRYCQFNWLSKSYKYKWIIAF